MINQYLLKSAVQKAFRRNDWQLFKKSFHALWDKDRNWLLWRGLVLPAEDGWLSVRDIGIAMRKAQAMVIGDPDRSRKILLDAFKDELATKKNQDANALYWWVYNYYHEKKPAFSLESLGEKVNHVRFYEIALELYEFLYRFETGDFKEVKKELWSEIWDKVQAYSNVAARTEKELLEAGADNDYMCLRETVGALYFRSLKGGGVDYQVLFLAAALLAIDAHDDGIPLIAEVSSSAYDTSEYQDYECVPWFCVDMYTMRGKQILRYLQKKYLGRFTKQQLEDIWFLNSSARVNETCPRSQVWGALKETIYNEAQFNQYEWTEIELLIKKLLREG